MNFRKLNLFSALAGITLSSSIIGAGTISGVVWEDADGNRIFQLNENRLSGIQINLDANRDGTPERTAITDAEGRYRFTGLEAGSYIISWTLPPGSGLSEEDFEQTFPLEPPTQFDIVIVYPSGIDPQYRTLFEAAEKRWEEVIIGDLPDVEVPDFGIVDDLVIEATVEPVDGPFGILAAAGPRFIRPGERGLPATGIMFFDVADIGTLAGEGGLQDVILHEMGHVLGIGTLWQPFGFLEAPESDDPRYTAPLAVAVSNELLGVEDTSLPVEDQGGPGSRLGHWRDSVYQNELMTSFYEGPNNPLSLLTSEGLADLGYLTDSSVVDPFALAAAPDDEEAEQSFLEPIPRVNWCQNLTDRIEVLPPSSIVANRQQTEEEELIPADIQLTLNSGVDTVASQNFGLRRLSSISSPTPTPTPTPPPVSSLNFSFSSSADGWQFGEPVPGFTEAAGSGYDSGSQSLALRTVDNNNTFGFLFAPEISFTDNPSSAPLNIIGGTGEDSLYRARFTVSSDVNDPGNTPGLRFRAAAGNFSQTTELNVSSTTVNGFTPTSTNTMDYDLYFQIPENQSSLRLFADVLNFGGADAANASVFVQNVTVENIDLNLLSTPEIVRNDDLDQDSFQNLYRVTGADSSGSVNFLPVTNNADDENTGRGLRLGPVVNRSTAASDVHYGSFESTSGVPMNADRLYEIEFYVSSDASSRSQVPSFRLRVNDESLNFAKAVQVDSINNSSRVPVDNNPIRYKLWLATPLSLEGNQIRPSFDYILPGPSDNSGDVSITLEQLIMKEYEIPFF